MAKGVNYIRFRLPIPEDKQEEKNTIVSRLLTRARDFDYGFGKPNFILTCPFCDKEHRVYLRSLQSSGKVCSNCGAAIGTKRANVSGYYYKLFTEYNEKK